MDQKEERLFQNRLNRHVDELRWLYMELYHNDSMFAELCQNLYRFAGERPAELKKRDLEREADPGWYKSNALTGMMMYIDNFARDLNGLREKLPYIEQTGVNLLHLMPFLDTVPGRSDGGYAVADFRKVRPDLGTMEDLEKLAALCHKKGINLCMDFVMNHTSQDHEWAKRARQGEGEYMSRYFFFADPAIPAEYEKTVPQVFPTTAPGNFTWLEDCGHYVMTSFYPYQWDLNYQNPRVFNEMMYNYLYLANRGMDMIRIDAVPYIWKELGTDCRNRPQVHTIVRMMRMIGEIVCPSVILLGEVVMEPVKVVPYFGSIDKPECHLLYNVTTMCTTWHTVATRDTRLLRRQLDAVNALPKNYVFLNYLRCHDDIGWGLDYDWLHQNFGTDEVLHKRYLNDYFQGFAGNSNSRGELYNDDITSGDARFCGTTASLCGIEKAGFEQDQAAMERAVQFDLTLHAMMFMQTGIPMLYSGDELAQVNDYSYKEDPRKADDSRYLHRGRLRWKQAEHIHDLETTEEEKCTAERAVEIAGEKFAAMLAAMDNAYMQARAADIKDVTRRILNNLMGVVEGGIDSEVPVILAADDLAPSETIQLDKSKILGFITQGGSGNSHTAILARTMGIPAISGLGDALKPEIGGRMAYIDGETGQVAVEPDDITLAAFQGKYEKQQEMKALMQNMKGQEDVTLDGRKLMLYCNIGSPEDISAVLSNDGRGIGLFRSEFLYLASDDYPSEEDQFQAYKEVAAAMEDRRVVIRTLDIGADKQVGYFGLQKEENPALGVRAIRICLNRPEVFRTQLRALYRASAYGKVAIMFPMITSVWEVKECKRACQKVMAELDAEGVPYQKDTEIGIMIETPASILVAEELAKEVDFFSVGTNDLTQYTLACDRQANDLGKFFDPHHPAVLRALKIAADAAHKAGIWIGICGELGADLSLLETFLAIGIDELSVSPASVLPLRARIRQSIARTCTLELLEC